MTLPYNMSGYKNQNRPRYVHVPNCYSSRGMCMYQNRLFEWMNEWVNEWIYLRTLKWKDTFENELYEWLSIWKDFAMHIKIKIWIMHVLSIQVNASIWPSDTISKIKFRLQFFFNTILCRSTEKYFDSML